MAEVGGNDRNNDGGEEAMAVLWRPRGSSVALSRLIGTQIGIQGQWQFLGGQGVPLWLAPG